MKTYEFLPDPKLPGYYFRESISASWLLGTSGDDSIHEGWLKSFVTCIEGVGLEYWNLAYLEKIHNNDLWLCQLFSKFAYVCSNRRKRDKWLNFAEELDWIQYRTIIKHLLDWRFNGVRSLPEFNECLKYIGFNFRTRQTVINFIWKRIGESERPCFRHTFKWLGILKTSLAWKIY